MSWVEEVVLRFGPPELDGVVLGAAGEIRTWVWLPSGDPRDVHTVLLEDMGKRWRIVAASPSRRAELITLRPPAEDDVRGVCLSAWPKPKGKAR